MAAVVGVSGRFSSREFAKSVLTLKQSRSRILCTLTIVGRSNVRNYSQNSRTYRLFSRRNDLMTVTGLTAALGLASWYGRSRIFPDVDALEPKDGIDPASNRLKFNFIADVVKKAAPAVVYIEIQAR